MTEEEWRDYITTKEKEWDGMAIEEQLRIEKTNSPASEYKLLKDKFNKKDEFGKSDIKNHSINNLNCFYRAFEFYSCIFFNLQTTSFKECMDIRKKKEKDEKVEPKLAAKKEDLDLASAYVSQIQNNYLNRISSELNRRYADANLESAKSSILSAERSISLARKSIYLGWGSIILGLISVFLAAITIIPDGIKRLLSKEASVTQCCEKECCGSGKDSIQNNNNDTILIASPEL